MIPTSGMRADPLRPPVAAPNVSLSIEGPIGRIRIGNGARRNSLSRADWEALALIAQGLTNHDELRVVVIRGASGTFSAGFDIRGWSGAQRQEVANDFDAMERALTAVEDIEVVTIAVVEGVAAGSGCQLALACDLRLVASSARIGMPILRLGLLPSRSFGRRVAEQTGTARARELFYTGRLLEPNEARRWGIASEVVEDSEIDSALEHMLGDICSQPRSGLVAAKASCNLQSNQKAGEDADLRYFDEEEFPVRVCSFLQSGSSHKK